MATDAQDRLPIFDYPVISDGKPPHDPPKPGDTWDETVWKELPPPGSKKPDKKEVIGTVTIVAKGPAEDPRFDAEFTFDGLDCRITVKGPVPGKGQWRGPGKAIVDGCERHEDDHDIEFWNPKRW